MASQRKVAFITGANRGIGLETARGLAALGYAVALGCRDEEKGRAAAEELKAGGAADVEVVRCDVADIAGHDAVARRLEECYGGLDALVNNAGIMVDPGELSAGGLDTTLTVSMETLRRTFDVNFFAVVALTRSLLPLLRKSPAGRIVNLSSVLASLTLHANPKSPIYHMKAFAYDASKTALNAFTVHLAHELRDTPIKVNSAHPGWVQTELGGKAAPMPLDEGGKTSVQLATLPEDGPTGGFFHLGEPLPW